VDRAQLIKGFQAAFWFAFTSAVLAALGALTLRIGRRGTKEEKQARKEQDRLQLQSEEPSDEVATEVPLNTVIRGCLR
jgi:hypothetical protein